MDAPDPADSYTEHEARASHCVVGARPRRRQPCSSGRRQPRGSAVRPALVVHSQLQRSRAQPVQRPGDPAVVQRFRIEDAGETVVEAQDVRDAIRQAESLGATEITAVSRAD